MKKLVHPHHKSQPPNQSQPAPEATIPGSVEEPKPEKKSEMSLLKRVLIALSLPLAGLQVVPVPPPGPKVVNVAQQPVPGQGKPPNAKSADSHTSAKIKITFPQSEHNEKEVSKLRSEVEKSNPELHLTWNPITFTLEISVVGLASLGDVLFKFWKEHQSRKSGGRIHVKVGDAELVVEKAEDIDKAIEAAKKLQSLQKKEPVVQVFVEEN